MPYPELKQISELINAINLEFKKWNHDLKVTVNENLDQLSIASASIEFGKKLSQIYIAADKNLYLSDFWSNGFCLAHGNTENTAELVKAIEYWLMKDISTQTFVEHFNFIQPNFKADSFDTNRKVEYAWKFFMSEDDHLKLKDFVTLASKDEILNKLFPFTSLYTLCFSKCTDFPFDTTDLPNVTPIEHVYFTTLKNVSERPLLKHSSTDPHSQFYVVTKHKTQYIGEGDAQETLRIVRNNLPLDIGPARKGTA